MRQVLFVVPGLGVAVPGFGLFFLLACWSALGLALHRARRGGIDPQQVVHLALWLFPGGMVGARLMFAAQHPEAMHGPEDLVRVGQGGIVFYGCLLGGLVGAAIAWARRPFPFGAMADAVAPALALGVALGRLGCFCNGCCFGGPCSWPWAVRFPAGTLPWARHLEAGRIAAADPYSRAVHPTQLYEAIGAALLLGLLLAFFPHRRRDGRVMALAMMGYGALRLPVEALRGDEPGVLGGLTAAQVISLGLLAGGAILWRNWVSRQGTRTAEEERIGRGKNVGVQGKSRTI